MKERMIDTLHRLIGVPATSALIAEYGGRSLYVPTPAHIRANAGHPLAKLVGTAGAMALADYVQGGEIYIPTGAWPSRKGCTERARRIAEDAMEGESAADLCRRHGVSYRTVLKAISRST